MNLKDEDLFDINLSKIQLFDLLSTAVDDAIEIKKKNKQLQTRIDKALHLITHSDITDYRVFDEELLKILRGEENE